MIMCYTRGTSCATAPAPNRTLPRYPWSSSLVLTFSVATGLAIFVGSSTHAALQFQFLAKLDRPNPLDQNYFGTDVAIHGHLAVVGSSTPDYRLSPGHAYVYDFSDPSNISITELTSPTDSMNHPEWFGASVAIQNSLVFVGSNNYGTATSGDDAGAVHMFDLSDPSNILYHEIRAFDEQPHNFFGTSLAISGNRLVVGAPDLSIFDTLPPAVYVLDITDPLDISQTKITLDTSRNVERFGEHLDIDGDLLIVSDSSDSQGGRSAGAVYLYDLSNAGGTLVRKILAYDSGLTKSFGRRVAISDETFLAYGRGNIGNTPMPGAPSGVVYSHDLSNLSNIIQTEFIPDTIGVTSFGGALDLSGDIAIIAGTGGVFAYDLSDPTSPVNLGLLTIPGGVPESFGASMAFDGRTAIISAQNSNSAYLFRLVPEPTTATSLLFGLASMLQVALSRQQHRRLTVSRKPRVRAVTPQEF